MKKSLLFTMFLLLACEGQIGADHNDGSVLMDAQVSDASSGFDCSKYSPEGKYMWVWTLTEGVVVCPEEDIFVMEWDLAAPLAAGCSGHWSQDAEGCSYETERVCVNSSFNVKIFETSETTLEGTAIAEWPFVGKCYYDVYLVNVEHLFEK